MGPRAQGRSLATAGSLSPSSSFFTACPFFGRNPRQARALSPIGCPGTKGRPAPHLAGASPNSPSAAKQRHSVWRVGPFWPLCSLTGPLCHAPRSLGLQPSAASGCAAARWPGLAALQRLLHVQLRTAAWASCSGLCSVQLAVFCPPGIGCLAMWWQGLWAFRAALSCSGISTLLYAPVAVLALPAF